DDAAEYYHRRHHHGHRPHLGGWHGRRWRHPLYESDDDAPAQNEQAVEGKVQGAENDAEEASGTGGQDEDEASEYRVVFSRLHRCEARRRLGLPCLPHHHGYPHRRYPPVHHPHDRV
ncbi:unnamed protein product, partial [Ixodes hexagonus]